MADWLTTRAVLEQILQSPLAEREAVLDRLCAGEPNLRAEVDSLLKWEGSTRGFLESPILGPLTEEGARPAAFWTIARYQIECELGRGGMGTVYLAARSDGTFEQLSTGQDFACAIAADDSVECWGRDLCGESTPP